MHTERAVDLVDPCESKRTEQHKLKLAAIMLTEMIDYGALSQRNEVLSSHGVIHSRGAFLPSVAVGLDSAIL